MPLAMCGVSITRFAQDCIHSHKLSSAFLKLQSIS